MVISSHAYVSPYLMIKLQKDRLLSYYSWDKVVPCIYHTNCSWGAALRQVSVPLIGSLWKCLFFARLLLDCNHGYLHAVTEFTLPSASMKTLFFNPFFIGDKLQATCKLNKANLNLISPQDLNKFMCGTVYLVGCQLTLADIMLYYALHPVMMELSVQEREQLVNLSRWFNQVNFSITRI